MSFASYPSLSGRVVVITGGAAGIGASAVEHFAAQGSRVAFLDLDTASAASLVQRLASHSLHTPLFLRCDLTDIPSLQAAVGEIDRTLGPPAVLINNAGSDTRHHFDEVTPEQWDRNLAVNLRHQFFAAQAVAPAMRSARAGSIINMSSISWIIPTPDVPVYIAAKAAIVGITKSLAHELGPHNIRVNAVLPGAILTDRQRRDVWSPAYEQEILSRQSLKRSLLPEEVSRLLLFLAADDSSAITNQSYIIDGGWV